ncbi:MAG: class I SAM-dependent methyltransferase [Alphaproteobacteria bacterium]|nr:class I SAM-dependent methyltransferase [Alphaproteobacteria bacterium]
MAVLGPLCAIYEQRGFEVSTGFNPTHVYGEPISPFTYLFREGETWNAAAGIAVQELYFLETLAADWQPANILIIGNSFGWSALAMALIFPKAHVLAVDCCDTEDTLEGLRMTNKIAQEEGLSNLLAVQGTSPQDMERVARDHAPAPWDMVFIDGEHTERQIERDFRGTRPLAAPDALWLFHDAISFELLGATARLAEETGLIHQPLWRTPSGIAALVPPALVTKVAPALHAFAGSESSFRRMRELGRFGSSERLISALKCPKA